MEHYVNSVDYSTDFLYERKGDHYRVRSEAYNGTYHISQDLFSTWKYLVNALWLERRGRKHFDCSCAIDVPRRSRGNVKQEFLDGRYRNLIQNYLKSLQECSICQTQKGELQRKGTGCSVLTCLCGCVLLREEMSLGSVYVIRML